MKDPITPSHFTLPTKKKERTFLTSALMLGSGSVCTYARTSCLDSCVGNSCATKLISVFEMSNSADTGSLAPNSRQPLAGGMHLAQRHLCFIVVIRQIKVSLRTQDMVPEWVNVLTKILPPRIQ